MGWESNAIFQVVIIQGSAGSGLFAYSPSPALGNLVASVAAASGIDPYGNAYLAGDVSYASAIGRAVALLTNSLQFFTAPGAGGPWTLQAAFALSAGAAPFQLIATVPSSLGLSVVGPLSANTLSLLNPQNAPILTAQNNQSAPTSPIAQIIANAVPDFSFGIQVVGDTNQRFRVDSDGSVHWGTGAAATDTVLTRSGIGTLGPVSLSSAQAAGDVLKITNTTAAPSGASAHLIAAAAADRLLALQVTGDTVTRLLVDSNGKMNWGPGGAAAQDTDLFRAAVGVLQTDSTLAITNQAAPATLAGAAQLYAASGQPAYKNPAGLAANLSASQLAVVTQNVVTQNVLTNLASATIPAADAEIGAVYRVNAYGSGTWGSTQQQLTFGARFGATAATTAATTAIANTALAASAAFQWWAEVIATNVTTGVTGTWQVQIRGTVTQTANAILPGTAADNTIPFAAGTTAAAPYTLDTTIAELLGVSAQWASTTGAPTLTKTASFFERIA